MNKKIVITAAASYVMGIVSTGILASRIADVLTKDPEGRGFVANYKRGPILLSSREEAEKTLLDLGWIIESDGYATVSHLNELVGFASTSRDGKYGWSDLSTSEVRMFFGGRKGKRITGYGFYMPKPVLVK